MNVPRGFWPLSIAVVLTLANAPKPLVVDDAAYYEFAAQIAEHPADPYGFEIIWYQHAEPAFDVLAPLAVPYWWAVAIGLFGDDPLLWKLWLFPFLWAFTASLDFLVGRFAPRFRYAALAMTALSPVIVPAINLMLDVPAYGLMLAGIALFIGGAGPGRVVATGTVLGLAMQAKYTALLGPGVVLLYGLTHRRSRGAVISCAVAVLLFAAWELFLFQVYGRSHFLTHLTGQASSNLADSLWDRARMAGPLFGYFGGLGQAVGLASLLAVRAPRRLTLTLLGTFLAQWIAVPFVGREWSGLVIGLPGILIFGAVLACWVALLRAGTPGDRFLAAWFVLEVLGYFALTPFGAARRLIGLLTLATLIAFRVWQSRPVGRDEQRGLVVVTALGIGLGLVYGAVDLIDAFPEKWAAEQSAAWIRERDPDAEIWFTGHWGFQFYAGREGMRPIFPDVSVVSAGDWVVLPEPHAPRPHGQMVEVDPGHLSEEARLSWGVPLPVRTISPYYGGHVPILRHRGPRTAVTIYRVGREWHPNSPPN